MSDDVSVTVDRDFARFDNKSFAINKINTVEVRSRRPYSPNAHVAWGLMALISLMLFSSGTAGGIVFALLLCGFFAFLAFRAWKRSKVVEYQLFLVTSSGAVQAIKSEDVSMIDGLRNKIERAMAGKFV